MSITILFGSETGNAETLAETASEELKKAGCEATVLDMGDVKPADLAGFETLLIITSTWGDGEPPTNAYDLWTALSKKPEIDLGNIRFAVLALGDTAYPEFCRCGKDFDEWLEELGAKRLLDRVDCDTDYDQPYGAWIRNVIEKVNAVPVPQL